MVATRTGGGAKRKRGASSRRRNGRESWSFLEAALRGSLGPSASRPMEPAGYTDRGLLLPFRRRRQKKNTNGKEAAGNPLARRVRRPARPGCGPGRPRGTGRERIVGPGPFRLGPLIPRSSRQNLAASPFHVPALHRPRSLSRAAKISATTSALTVPIRPPMRRRSTARIWKTRATEGWCRPFSGPL